jgi:hypothetical protein
MLTGAVGGSEGPRFSGTSNPFRNGNGQESRDFLLRLAALFDLVNLGCIKWSGS